MDLSLHQRLPYLLLSHRCLMPQFEQTSAVRLVVGCLEICVPLLELYLLCHCNFEKSVSSLLKLEVGFTFGESQLLPILCVAFELLQ